jgi:hypothetical protein
MTGDRERDQRVRVRTVTAREFKEDVRGNEGCTVVVVVVVQPVMETTMTHQVRAVSKKEVATGERGEGCQQWDDTIDEAAAAAIQHQLADILVNELPTAATSKAQD